MHTHTFDRGDLQPAAGEGQGGGREVVARGLSSTNRLQKEKKTANRPT